MNNILKTMYELLNREERRKEILIINFTKEKIQKAGIENYYALAVCANEAEYNKVKYNIKNEPDHKYFDKIVIFDSIEWKKIIMNNKRHILMNPPYIRGKKEPLYLEILKDVISSSDEKTKIVSINPANYFQDIMLYSKGSYAEELNYCVSKLINCTIIKDTDATTLFKNAIFAYDLMIGYFNKNDKPMDINSFQINTKYNELREKILKKLEPNEIIKGTIFSVGTKNPLTQYFIKITYKHGNPGKKDMFDILATENNKENLFIKSDKLNNSRCYLSYQTKEDRDNAYNLFNTSITLKFINKIFRTGAQIAYKYIPVMNNNKITEAELCNYFGITGYISDTEAEPGSEWEIILNTLKDYK